LKEEGRKEGRRKKEEGRRKKEEGRRKKEEGRSLPTLPLSPLSLGLSLGPRTLPLDLKIHPLNPLNLVHGFVAELPSSFICGFMNSLYSVFKFLVGFLLAIVLMAGASVAAALYFAAKLTTVPERPVFPNDKAPVQIAGAAPKSTAQASPVSTSSDAPSPKPLEPGAYRALVTQPIGLILRDTGSRDSNRIGGVGYKEKVVVLEESPDKEWQRIRVEDGNREGWVKGGNTEKVEGE
jgi:hypothetical protein